MNISGKNGLVLGATRGIGRTIARVLAEKGVRLALPWFDWPQDCLSLQQEFKTGPTEHFTLKADLRNPNEVADMVTQIEQQFGHLDILVNNIERGGMPVVHGNYNRTVNREQWQVEMETTLHAKWQVFNQCLPLLRKSNDAAVLNISSIAGIVGRSGAAGLLFNDGYAAANRGIASLTETWARIGAPLIRVNEIMLGLIDTRHGPGTRGWELLKEQEQEELLNHTLLQRTGTPEEVARMILFVLEDADFMTGTTLKLDGGYTLGGEAPSRMPDGVI